MTVAVKEAEPTAAAPISQQSAPAEGVTPAGSHSRHQQHEHGRARRKGQKTQRTITTASVVIAVVSIIVALTVVRQAAKDERVRAAVSDSVQRINETLSEHVDGFLEQLSRMSDRVNSMLPGDEAPRPGQIAAQAGLRAHHPIVIVPGFVTSGLELWQGESCAQSYFRQRLWGTLSMAQTLLSDRMCWMRHMKLDPVTGSDPPGIKLRAAKALEAVDYFVPGYWVFSKLIQSLSDIGYDNNNLIAVPYDWRLPIPLMERRDGFFTRLKREVELQHQLSRGIKPLLVSHSYGATVTVTFLHWVEQQSPGWVDTHLQGYVNLAGPLLGLPKALSPMLSGETRETVDMMAGLAVLVEQYLGKQSRAALFRTWGSVMAMLPVGGSKVWGNATFAPDDDDAIKAAGRSYGGIIAEVRSADSALKDAVGKNDSSLLSTESLQLLHTTLNNWGHTLRLLGIKGQHDDDDDDDEDDDGDSNHNSSDNTDKAAAAQAAANDKEETDGSNSGEGSNEDGGHSQEDKNELQVRFLDVTNAITALARTAGEQFTMNLKKWSPAGQALHQQLDKVLEAHRQAADARAARELDATSSNRCETGGPGESQSSCGAEGGPGAAGSAADAACGHAGPTGGPVCGDSEEQQYQQQVEASTSSGTSGEEAAAIDASHKGAEGAEVEGGSSGATGAAGSNGGSSGGSGLLGVLKKAVGLGDSGTNNSTDEEMKGPGAVHPANVVQVPLPNARNFKVYCFYGVGTPTERGYHYLKTRKQGVNGVTHTEWSVNNMVDDVKSGLESGVQLSPDGDGTVPLLSLGALCAGGWRTKRLNPAGLDVVIREYPNNPVPVLRDARGGPNASTHVEILGNEPMLHDLLHIAAGRHQDIKDSILTKIHEIASKIPWDEL